MLLVVLERATNPSTHPASHPPPLADESRCSRSLDSLTASGSPRYCRPRGATCRGRTRALLWCGLHLRADAAESWASSGTRRRRCAEGQLRSISSSPWLSWAASAKPSIYLPGYRCSTRRRSIPDFAKIRPEVDQARIGVHVPAGRRPDDRRLALRTARSPPLPRRAVPLLHHGHRHPLAHLPTGDQRYLPCSRRDQPSRRRWLFDVSYGSAGPLPDDCLIGLVDYCVPPRPASRSARLTAPD